jgi:hypothetical protein
MCTSGSQARQGLLAAASNQLMRRELSASLHDSTRL